MTEAQSLGGKDVFVVGGANSAGQGAVHFSKFARTVTMLIRSGSLDESMSKYLIDRILATDNIKVMCHTQVKEVHGSEGVESITLDNTDSGTGERIPAGCVFIFIGAAPRTEWLGDAVERDRLGFILTGQDLVASENGERVWNLKRDPFLLETSLPGAFAAGDVRHGSGKHVATAVGDGSTAVMSTWRYLEDIGL